jgi:hypothetical protein
MESRLVVFDFFIFFVGILYKSSCKKPKGHKKEQIVRPKKAPIETKKPAI